MPVLVVLLADVFHQLVAGRLQPRHERDRPRPRVRAGVVNRDLVLEPAHVEPRPALDRVQSLGVRRAIVIEPELVVEADRVDHQRVLLERTDRVAEPGRVELGRVLAAIHEDLPVAVNVPFVEDEHVRRLLVRVVLDETERIRRPARHAHRHAEVVRVLFFLARLHDLFRRGQDRQVLHLHAALRHDVADRPAADPQPVQVDDAIGQPRCRTSRKRGALHFLTERADRPQRTLPGFLGHEWERHRDERGGDKQLPHGSSVTMGSGVIFRGQSTFRPGPFSTVL